VRCTPDIMRPPGRSCQELPHVPPRRPGPVALRWRPWRPAPSQLGRSQTTSGLSSSRRRWWKSGRDDSCAARLRTRSGLSCRHWPDRAHELLTSRSGTHPPCDRQGLRPKRSFSSRGARGGSRGSSSSGSRRSSCGRR
jgi:hypothetical protein